MGGKGFIDAHRRSTGFINARHRWTGHLRQGRFGAIAMDEAHLANALRHVSLNPVRARRVERAADGAWSSVGAHLAAKDDDLLRVAPVLERSGDFASFRAERDEDAEARRSLRQSETSCRPVGSAAWVAAPETGSGRSLAPQKRGPKPGAALI
ncbi:MAG TPA: hypothetical protein VMT54_21395 [Candidatus Cybelea sp.]|nr:hypothetical protein [Candidatus Cybelea sp.]